MLTPLSKPLLKSVITFSSTLAMGSLLFWHLLLTNITSITCTDVQTNDPCSPQILQSLQTLVGKKLFFTKIENNIATTPLASTHYQLKSYSKDLFLGNLDIQIEPLKAMYKIQDANGTQFSVNEKGYVLVAESASVDSTICTVYQVFLEDRDRVNEPVRSQIDQVTHSNILTILETLSLINADCISLTITDPSTWLLTLSPNALYVINPAEIEKNLTRLAVLHESQELSKIEGNYTYIDLRFELPVLRNAL